MFTLTPSFPGDVTGSQVMLETLRQICIFKIHKDEKWFRYMEQFYEYCYSSGSRQFQDKCSDNAMAHAGIKSNIKVIECLTKSVNYDA